MHYSISEIAKMTGLSTYTLRYYETEGILFNVRRDEKGRRYYTEENIGWLELVECLKETGLTLKEIKENVSLFSDLKQNYKQRVELFERQQKILEDRIKSLQQSIELTKFKQWYYKNLGTIVSIDDPDRHRKMEEYYQKNVLNQNRHDTE